MECPEICPVSVLQFDIGRIVDAKTVAPFDAVQGAVGDAEPNLAALPGLSIVFNWQASSHGRLSREHIVTYFARIWKQGLACPQADHESPLAVARTRSLGTKRPRVEIQLIVSIFLGELLDLGFLDVELSLGRSCVQVNEGRGVRKLQDGGGAIGTRPSPRRGSVGEGPSGSIIEVCHDQNETERRWG